MEKKRILAKSAEAFAVGAAFGAGILGISAVYAGWTFLSQVGTASNGSQLSSTEWNKMVSNFSTIDAQIAALSGSVAIPAGTVIAYNGTACPTGWTEAAGSGVPTGAGGSSTLDLRGEFIRGWDHGKGTDATRTFGSSQTDAFKSHNHPDHGLANMSGHGWSIAYQPGTSYPLYANAPSETPYVTGDTGGTETRPRNVALTYCVKN